MAKTGDRAGQLQRGIEQAMATESAPVETLQFDSKKTYRIYTKEAPQFSLAIRGGMVVLKAADRNDEYQHWRIDDRYGSKVKDEQGNPGFAIVNKATELGIKHPVANKRLVQLERYEAEYFKETFLWTQGKITDDPEFYSLRVVNNINLHMDSFHEPGTNFDGRLVGNWEWNAGNNQRFMISEIF